MCCRSKLADKATLTIRKHGQTKLLKPEPTIELSLVPAATHPDNYLPSISKVI